MHIKIFGERFTSTNALTQIIAKHSSSPIHPGTADRLDDGIGLKLKKLRKWRLDGWMAERTLDKVFIDRPLVHQWKHCATNFDSIDPSCNTHFLFTIRHPMSWVISFFKHPYHCLIKMPQHLHEFLECKWKTIKRERLSQKRFSPLALYEIKIHSYMNFIRILEDQKLTYSVLKFEDLVLKQKQCYQAITPYLDRPSQSFREITWSTSNKANDQNKSLKDYQTYYENEEWRKEVDAIFLKHFHFDKKLLKWMGYEI